MPEVVDPRWLLKAAASVAALALLCAYVTLCLFFYVGQWQFVLHPSRSVAHTPATIGLAFQPVRFGDDRAGQPQLTGWWLPADSATADTLLWLHNQDGSMSDTLAALRALHDAGLQVFVFDYRGYGQSEGHHPTERSMQADAESARTYLLQMRHSPGNRLVVGGAGLGASLAVHLCANHPEVPALVLLDADGDTASRVEADPRLRVLPVNLLFHERFPLADPLHNLRTPKLLVSFTRGEAPEIAQRAADPKTTAELAPNAGLAGLAPSLRRFLDEYVPQ